ncbi:MAG: DUF932 domain-containing protein [Verrucomicrobiota bacterium]
MNNTKQPPGMLLHCGAKSVDRRTVYNIPTPQATDTWFPLAHAGLIHEVESQLQASGFDLTGESHALSHDGARYFGVFEVSTPARGDRDYNWVVGIRNSHDKSYPAGLVAGSKVLVCDNHAFCGEVRISRKHTRFAARDLRHLTARAVGQLGERFHDLDERIEAYRHRRITNPQAQDIIIKAVDCRALTATQVPDALREWRQPEHEEFLPRNGWSLFNACTDVMKGTNPHTVVNRTQALHGLFDTACGLN